MAAPIFVPSVRTILSLMEASTGHLYYAAELEDAAALSKPTVLNTLDKLCEAGFLYPKPESDIAFRDRPPRIHYELTPLALSALRLIEPSK